MNVNSLKSKQLRPLFAVALAAGFAFGVAGCKSNASSQAPIVNASLGPDPAAANLAPVDANGQPTQVMGVSQTYTPQQQGESYPAGQQAPAPIVRGSAPDNSQYPVTDYGTPSADTYDQGYDNGEADAQTDQAPPPLPEYDQPPAPDDNDIWTPGYWGYADTGYYWVPGVWVAAPYYGALWTPGYWGWYGGHYRWHHGYWGRHIGFYGGINYGWGYVGTGYYGGYWNGNRFYYNRECSHVSPRVTTVYQRPVVVNNMRYSNVSNNRVSYNGGRGGVDARPHPYEIAAARERHVAPLPEQRQFHQQAAANRANAFAENHGRPAQAVFAQPVATHHMEAPVERGGFGGRPGQPANGNPPAAVQQRNTLMEQQHNQQLQQHNNLAEQQRNGRMQQQHNTQLEQQHNLQLQQQHNVQLQQQHNVQAEQQHNLQLQQQHNVQAEQQHNQQLQQQHNQQLQQQHNNVFDQHRVDETAQRNALQQQHQQQQVEHQRNVQVQQQRQAEMQQRNQQEQQRNFQIQQQQHVQQQQPQHVEQPHFQPQPQHIEQPRVEQPQHIEQPRMQPQPQHIEQPRMQPQPQHVEQPHIEQHAAPPPHVEAPRPAPQGGGGHPGGGGGHPGGGGHQR
ncbi:MAG TPA: hypothetical protein VGN16_20745 [Acidobacteriaceae bacterium]